LNVLFLVPYPLGCAPSQRFRFEQYLSLLDENKIHYKVSSFWDIKTWALLYKPNYRIKKLIGFIRGILWRIAVIFSITKFDFIFIHREASPVGPPIFEWIIGKVLNQRIIYDFDDAIWIPQNQKNNRLLSSFKFSNKVSVICKLSKKICVGNQYLSDYAKSYNQYVYIVPTTIDMMRLQNKTANHNNKEIVIGWTGSHSTLPFLQTILPVLKRLEITYTFKFLVIADKRPDFELSSLVFKQWSKSTEIEDLLAVNIGLMPLPCNEWAKGKCGLKALQYLALGIPALVSPIGVNSQIVKPGFNGYICRNQNDWYTNIEKLILKPTLRESLGNNGRLVVKKSYSVDANTAKFLALFS